MRARRAIVWSLTLTVVASLVVATPATADVYFDGNFVASFVVAAGLDHPCRDPQLPCPPRGTLVFDLPLPHELAATNFHLDWQHNRQQLDIASTVCLGAVVNVKQGRWHH